MYYFLIPMRYLNLLESFPKSSRKIEKGWRTEENKRIARKFGKDFFDFDNETPDLIVIGLQEIVDLNAKNVVASSNEKILKIWENVISSNLRWKGDYIFITSKSLVGVFIMLYAKSYLKNRISKVETDTVKCGVMNKLGNKGATIIRIRIDDTALCFLNCHLEAGHKKINERLENINDIHTKAFQQEGIGKKKVFFVCFFNNLR